MKSAIEKLRQRFALSRWADIKITDTMVTAYGVKLADVIEVDGQKFIRPVDSQDWESPSLL